MSNENVDQGKQAFGAWLFDFLLGARKLSSPAVVSLLLSSSFGLNALFYAAWLGHTIGAWALIIQAAWALSYVLLIPFARSFYEITSLHDLLGSHYGNRTRVFAALCSLTGIIYLMGWEMAVARATVGSYLVGIGARGAGVTTEIILAVMVAMTVGYTAVVGLRGDARADIFFNAIKLCLTTGVIGYGSIKLVTLSGVTWVSSAFPPFEVALANLGIWGAITNVVFNLSWQFVDNSSWQSIIGGSQRQRNAVERNLARTSTVVFLSIGVLGTVLGIGTVGLNGITQDNIINRAVALMPGGSVGVGFVLMSLVASCVMSLVGGMLLACSLTVVGDIAPSALPDLDARSRKLLSRATLVVAAIVAMWGIQSVIGVVGSSIFDFVYIVVITQLSLLGPVLGCWFGGKGYRGMWASIAAGLACGFGTAVLGVEFSIQYLIDGAGTFAVIASCSSALAIALLGTPNPDTTDPRARV